MTHLSTFMAAGIGYGSTLPDIDPKRSCELGLLLSENFQALRRFQNGLSICRNEIRVDF
jgi:hypothetical protein